MNKVLEKLVDDVENAGDIWSIKKVTDAVPAGDLLTAFEVLKTEILQRMPPGSLAKDFTVGSSLTLGLALLSKRCRNEGGFSVHKDDLNTGAVNLVNNMDKFL